MGSFFWLKIKKYKLWVWFMNGFIWCVGFFLYDFSVYLMGLCVKDVMMVRVVVFYEFKMGFFLIKVSIGLVNSKGRC